MVDDAHASGVFGANGRGTIDHFGVHGRVDIQVGTLSKAIGALGGYVGGSADLIDFLSHRARPFLFSTSHPPAVVGRLHGRAGCFGGRARNHRTVVGQYTFLQRGAPTAGIRHRRQRKSDHAGDHGEGSKAMTLSDKLFERGVFAQGIGFPTVARDKARVRTIVTATHSREDLQYALDAFEAVGREIGLI